MESSEDASSLGSSRGHNSPLNCFLQIPEKLQNSFKVNFRYFWKNVNVPATVETRMLQEKELHNTSEASFNKQMQTWRNNPNWSDQPPEMKVTVPEGSLCNLNLSFKVGLPPDAVYDIIIDPENKRVFKNIKEVVSRKVVLDEGSRQVVEVEQAAIWRFLWWSGTLAVHVFVDQNRRDHTVTFKQGRTGFMKRFEGCWKIEPLFVDEQICSVKPNTLAEYDSCTGGKGRVGSIVNLDQLIQPAVVPPPPISWYLRGITARTTEMLITDLLAETTRLRDSSNDAEKEQDLKDFMVNGVDIKERWQQRRKTGGNKSSFRS